MRHDAVRKSWQSVPDEDELQFENENDPLVRLKAHRMIPNHKFTFQEQSYDHADQLFFKKVLILNSGSSFGELALLNKDSKRQATVICENDCVMATLNHSQFTKSLAISQLKRREKLADFFMKIPLFNNQHRDSLIKFSYFCKKMKLRRYDKIYKIGQPANFVYIVYKGEFEVTRKLPEKDSLTHNYLLPQNV